MLGFFNKRPSSSSGADEEAHYQSGNIQASGTSG